MARIKRIVIPDTPHHVTQRGVRSMNIFFKHGDYEYYKKILFEQCKLHELKIVSYCLMTNHVHLIVIPKTKESLSKAIGETHRLYTRKINFEQKVKGHLFQCQVQSKNAPICSAKVHHFVTLFNKKFRGQNSGDSILN